MKITDVSKLRGPLGELHDQILGENGEERLAVLEASEEVDRRLSPLETIRLIDDITAHDSAVRGGL